MKALRDLPRFRQPSTAMHPIPRVPSLLATCWLLTTALTAQAPGTAPQWSTFFGASWADNATAVARGPGEWITIVGTTSSPGLATPGAAQSTYGGNWDAFVARFDPTLPPGQQLLWCTYFGGNDIEMAFDLEVDGAGVVTLVGTSLSTNLPVTPNALQSTRNGPGDAFFAQISANGQALTYATYLGGSDHDRITDLEPLPGGVFALLGVTDSVNLPNTAGTFFPVAFGGGTDSFVGRIDPSGAVPLWLTYIGGFNTDGFALSSFLAQGGPDAVWQGNLKRQALAVRGDTLLLVTANQPGSAYTTPGCFQATSNGAADLYYVEISAAGTSVPYATLIGGSANDWAKGLALHPQGGVVITGVTYSTNLPVSPNAYQVSNRQGAVGAPTDGFVMRFDPQAVPSHLVYSSYFGGDGGEDLFTAVAVTPSGLVTLAGSGYGGGGSPFPTTRGSHRPAAPSTDRCGAIVTMRLAGTGLRDLVYSTLLGGAWTVLHGVVLDELGNAIVVGRTLATNYPVHVAAQPTYGGSGDAVLTRLPMLPGGTRRKYVERATPACGAPLHAGVLEAPFAGNTLFGISASNAPPLGVGVLAFGIAPPGGGPQPLLNITLLVAPVSLQGPVTADGLGFASVPLPIPTNLPPGFQWLVQWAFLTNAACAGSGPLAASELLLCTSL